MAMNLGLPDPRDPDYQRKLAAMMRGEPVTMESQVAQAANAPISSGMMSGYVDEAQAEQKKKAFAERAADISGQERRVKSQRDYANSLRGNGPAKGKTVGPLGVYMAPNWGEALASAGSEALGGYFANKANKADEGLDKARTAQQAAEIAAAQADKDADNADRTLGRDLQRETLDAAADRNATQDELSAIEREKLDLRYAGEQEARTEREAESRRRWEAEQEAKKKKAEFDAAKEKGKLPKEIAALDSTSTVRKNAIEKGSKFLQAFESGAKSGTSRVLSGLIPGQYSDADAFDEEIEAFAEQAARAELQARGEIRPTDADVKGMKESLFGKGKGEQVNKNLLTEYLTNQIGTENQLREFKGEELMEMPNTEAIEGDWYGELFEGKKPAKQFTDEQIDNMTEEELDANGL